MSWFVGIDPGNTGAVAFYAPAFDALEIFDMPAYHVRVNGRMRQRVDVYRLGLILDRPGIRRVLIEDVHALPKQGVASTFTFGYNAGAVHGVIGALQWPMELVAPTRWKSLFKLTSAKDEARRAASRELPKYTALWPLKKHDGRAEAALLALLCARQAKEVS